MAYRYLVPTRTSGLRPMAGGQQGGSLFDLHRQMNRLFDDLFDSGNEGGSLSQGSGSSPLMDVHQEEDRIEITAELPGVREEDIDLSIEEGVLVLSGEKRSSREDSQGGYRERSYGRFERRITLPGNVDEDAIEADFEHGVLTITLPKAEKQRGRKIQLGGGGRRSGGQSAQPAGQREGAAQGAGSDAEGPLIDMDSSRVGGPGGEGGDHHTPGMAEDSSAAERSNS